MASDGFRIPMMASDDLRWPLMASDCLCRYADTVLAMGGSKPAAEVFVLFRGRAPQATALLRHDGLL